MKRDIEHLKLLAVFHFILGPLAFLVSSFAILYFVLGVMFVNGSFPAPKGQPAPPPAMGWIFIIGSSFVVLIGWSLAVCLIIAGVCLSRRKAYMFCCVVAGMSCIGTPVGTALGVFSLIVLMRPTVKDLFAGKIIEYDPDANDEDDEPLPPRRENRPRRADRPAEEGGRYTVP